MQLQGISPGPDKFLIRGRCAVVAFEVGGSDGPGQREIRRSSIGSEPAGPYRPCSSIRTSGPEPSETGVAPVALEPAPFVDAADGMSASLLRENVSVPCNSPS